MLSELFNVSYRSRVVVIVKANEVGLQFWDLGHLFFKATAKIID